MRKNIFVLLLCVLLFSCHSTDGMLTKRQRKTTTLLVGKVYDGENRSCSQVSVYLFDDKAEDNALAMEISDTTGSLYFPPLPFGVYFLKAEKPGFRSISMKIDLEIPEQSIYLNMLNADQILDRAIDAVESENYELSENYLEDLKNLGKEKPYGLYLKGIIAWKQGNSGKALSLIDRLIEEGNTDTYVLRFREKINGEIDEGE